MPLSEDEQRILSEIEARLYESDPALARQVGSTTVYSEVARNLKWAALGFFVGLVLLVVLLYQYPESWWLSFGGFLVMLISALAFERNGRRLGRVGLQQMTQSMRASGVRDFFSGAGQRARRRFQKDDE